MDCNEKKTPTPKDKIRNEKPAEEAAELTDEELAQVSGGVETRVAKAELNNE